MMTALSTELAALFGVALVGLLTLAAQGAYLSVQLGHSYLYSSRDDAPPKVVEKAGRFDRAIRNLMEAAVVFVPLTLIAELGGISNAVTQWAAIVFAVSRVLYVPAYIFDLVPLRTYVWTPGFLALFAYAGGIGWALLSA